MKNFILSLALILVPMTLSAQSRDKMLSIKVTAEFAEDLQGQQVDVLHTGYQISYGTLTLDANGECKVKVYAGEHSISVQRVGFETATANVLVYADTEVSLVLKEKVRTPYAIHSALSHDAFTAKNSVRLSWNVEDPVFSDDFEGYDAFAINFAPWSGIDADHETAAPLIGEYPNRGVLQYAQVINPLTVEPTWWYEYEVLRPCSGKQYVGFTRTSSGKANDDWLISPPLTIGTENVLSFMAKAADKYPERFQVYATTKLDNPAISDFTMISPGNYELVDYTRWHEKTYDLSAFAGQTIRFAIRYIGDYSHYGNFMLMVDDVFVGQVEGTIDVNPNELFVISLDGNEVGRTPEYNFTITDIPVGDHVIGIKAIYKAAETEVVETHVSIAGDAFANVTLTASADSKLSPEGTVLTILNTTTTEALTATVPSDGVISIPSLPKASYLLSSEEGAFNAISQQIDVTGDADFNVIFTDNIITPYNITVETVANPDGTLDALACWNQQLMFSDSFENYDDFATGTFGGWLSIDRDQMPVYPIGLGSTSNIVSFPGSGVAGNPLPIAPIVFNPWQTKPAMMPTDQAIAPPTGQKQIVFFSPQRGMADKWLISPEVEIHDNYAVEFTAKAYSIYPESMEICVSTGGTEPSDFTVVAVIDQLSAGEWTRYQADLKEYAGQKARVALHYTSYDAFFAQVDDVTIGSKDGEAESLEYGNVERYDVTLDGQEYGQTEENSIVLYSLSAESHTIGVKAVYRNGASEVAEYTFGPTDGIAPVHTVNLSSSAIYNLSGQKIATDSRSLPAGIYIRDGRKFMR